MKRDIDKTALSYWFPKLEAAGLPVPRTFIVPMPVEAQEDVWAAFDGKDGGGGLKPFCETLRGIMSQVGFPCFLRTDRTSGKHWWKRTCFVPDEGSIGSHVIAIAEYSEMAGFPGLPWDTWVVREFLPTIPYGVCPDYGDMPVCREFRCFVRDGEVLCIHQYWPLEALTQGGAKGIDYGKLCQMGGDEPWLRAMASAAGQAVGGEWSVDILETERGWFICDMAEAHKSFHWEGCPNGEAGQ